jgi:hypothetical protein
MVGDIIPEWRATSFRHRWARSSWNQWATSPGISNGAHAVLLRSKAAKLDPWLVALRARKHRLVVAVAVANKTARIAWAIMSKQETYRHAVVTA